MRQFDEIEAQTVECARYGNLRPNQRCQFREANCCICHNTSFYTLV